MKLAPSSGRLAPAFNPFDEEYLVEILNAVIEAWSRMIRPNRRELEDHITFRLAGRIANDPLLRDLPYDVVPQYWLLGLNGERLGRLDLRFKHRHSARDYFTFEAKRLHVKYPSGAFRPEYSKYTGKDGMMCFIDGKYASGMQAAGMLAYVMDGDCGRAWNGVQDQIESSRSQLQLLATSRLAISPLSQRTQNVVGGARLGETHHSVSARHLHLLHLILPVGLKAPLRSTSNTN